VNERDLAAFFEMGGYALYVWGSFAMCGAAALWEAVLLLHRRRRAIEDLRDDLARLAATPGARDGP
jgi:heme exporter protein D